MQQRYDIWMSSKRKLRLFLFPRFRNQGSPGYNVNDFYPRSSYLRDFVTTARQQSILFGESSLPVAVYIRSVDLFEPVIQQARQQ